MYDFTHLKRHSTPKIGNLREIRSDSAKPESKSKTLALHPIQCGRFYPDSVRQVSDLTPCQIANFET